MEHMDGDRLWEVELFSLGKSFANVAALFDSVFVSFYKGLSGACGAVLASTDDIFIQGRRTSVA